MKRTLIGGAIATLVAVPAVIGLWGNASFSQEVPVRVPASGQILTPTTSPSPTPSASSTIVDDNGGDVPRDQRNEPGDDRDVNGDSSTGGSSGTTVDDHSGSSSDDSGGGSSNSGSSNSGSSSDDSGHDSGDDSGSGHGGHGSDD